MYGSRSCIRMRATQVVSVHRGHVLSSTRVFRGSEAGDRDVCDTTKRCSRALCRDALRTTTPFLYNVLIIAE
jgi:hypothetical protein